MPGHLILVPTPIGNLGDITQRSIEALTSADYIACEDTRRTSILLDHLSLKKNLLRFDDHAGAEGLKDLQETLMAGHTVAYCSDAGMPGINDPGFELIRMARASEIALTVLPGPSSVLLALVASGLPCHRFNFYGYLSPKGPTRVENIKSIATREETTIAFEVPHRIHETLKDLITIIPDRQIALGRELTKIHEMWYRGTAQKVLELLGEENRGEMVLVISGAHAKTNLLEPNSILSDGLPPWAKRYLEAAKEGGITIREAAKPLAKHFGVSVSEIYRMALD